MNQQTTNSEASSPRIPFLRALANRNYRLYFGGQLVSLSGTWIQQTAMTWVVYLLRDSSFILGIVGFAGQIPGFFLAPLAGVLSDRWNRHRLLVITQASSMIQAFIMAFLAATGLLTVEWIIGLSLFLGFINAFDMTARQAFMTDMVESRSDLANAIALNSSMVNGTKLLGPALAGPLLGWLGAAWCFFLNGLSFLAVLAALLAMRLPPRSHPVRHRRVWHNLVEGFQYAFGFAPIRSILLLLALTSLLGFPFTVLMPLYARDIFHGGPEVLGLLLAAQGVGALAGALYLAARKTILGLGIRIAFSPAVLGLGLIGFSYTGSLWLALILLVVTGVAMMVQMASSNTILQTIVEEDKRGRVMSFYAMAFLGMAPFGTLLIGWLAEPEVLGTFLTLRLAGLCCIAGSVAFLFNLRELRAHVRPIYRQMGILPAESVETASELLVPPEHT
jgi:MFS family permease